MYGFSKLPVPSAVILTLLGVAGLVLFVLIELKATTPVLNVRLFSENRVFALSNVSALINYASTFALTFIVIGLAILGFGFGLFSSPNTNVVMSSVDKKIYGTASATLATMRSTGMMFSMAIASLSMHLFLGNQKINTSNIPDFIKSTKSVFIIFTILSFIGVFLSLAKRKVQNNPV